MTFRKLSDQVQQLSNPQRSDTFVKLFRSAVREGEFDAVYIPERFSLPKQYSKRGSEEKYAKEAKDMVFEVTSEFEAWFERIDRDLTGNRRNAKVKPSLEAIERGEVDFTLLAQETRRKMEASFHKGQNLGSSRAKARSAPKSGRSGRASKAKAAK
ncbi:hypothetical protein [Deinococcus yavapaiensis]|uniref:Uncharacterized protein n=1 Tax=Deinococcus yavapaiensis KR-236 TaxID=694435 RepID=A0A318S510_9DEIO|nr:hypothetical protein [Deinococcus yavapaiensis]PYE53564.1 hypothetical protein DES52_10893 [Deinococcus yavapaiensis KR-236]